eukprot:scaffold3243_cov155-Cylindrotheca_fusiformis.AAC.1
MMKSGSVMTPPMDFHISVDEIVGSPVAERFKSFERPRGPTNQFNPFLLAESAVPAAKVLCG